jgi:hypothetical protein
MSLIKSQKKVNNSRWKLEVVPKWEIIKNFYIPQIQASNLGILVFIMIG